MVREVFSMKRFLTSSTLALALVSGICSVAQACPMCKYANEADQTGEHMNRRPNAYMYSILFMLAMPATIFTVFGISFYRLSQQAESANDDSSVPGDIS
jgi:hypothetical protein